MIHLSKKKETSFVGILSGISVPLMLFALLLIGAHTPLILMGLLLVSVLAVPFLKPMMDI